MVNRWNHFINGVESSPKKGEYLNSYTPQTGKVFAEVADGTAEDVNKAVVSASQAFQDWQERRPIERGRILLAIATKLRENVQEFARLESSETGKPVWQSPLEIEGAAAYFEYYGGLVNLFQGEKIDLGGNYHSYTIREPFGPIAVITPWNAPINQAARGIAPALAVGNTVVSKPSEFTSATTVNLAKLAVEECGIPKGVFNVVLGEGKKAGIELVKHPNIKKVAFTGSVRAGQEIGRIAAERILPLTLELGGKSPNIVFEDADLRLSIGGAIRAFILNAGQICLAGTRLLVQESIHDTFVKGLVAGVANVKVGPDPDCQVGPITTHSQYERVCNFFDIAVSEGAKVECGGTPEKKDSWGEGWFLPPTIYSGVTTDMRIAQEEIFGPVLVVIPFKDEEDAIRIANDSEYGLAAGIWTNNLGRAHRVARKIQAGQIYVNEYQAGGVETPLGGYKKSGYGREKGIESLHCYTQLKCVTMKI